MKSTKIKIASGSEVRISESAITALQIPTKRLCCLKKKLKDTQYVTKILKEVQTDENEPYFVQASLDKKYGSPINVLWFRKN